MKKKNYKINILIQKFYQYEYLNNMFAGDVDGVGSTIVKPEEISDRFNNYQKTFHFREIVLPHNKSFTSFEARLETFDKCIRLKQNTRTFSDAGLYYIGNVNYYTISFDQI